MYSDFEFFLKTRIIFGAGALSKVGAEVSNFGVDRALIVTDTGVATSGLLDQLLQSLKAHRITFAIYDKVVPNPTVEVIDTGEDFRVVEDCDLIIGFGGGSSIDTAKGIGILATSGGKIADYAGAGKVRSPPIPVLAIPTTAGTGAEVSTAIAVTNESVHNAGAKFAVRAPLVSPRVAILDHTVLSTLPQKIARDSTMDTLCHLIEAYVSRGAVR